MGRDREGSGGIGRDREGSGETREARLRGDGVEGHAVRAGGRVGGVCRREGVACTTDGEGRGGGGSGGAVLGGGAEPLGARAVLGGVLGDVELDAVSELVGSKLVGGGEGEEEGVDERRARREGHVGGVEQPLALRPAVGLEGERSVRLLLACRQQRG